MSNSGKMLSKEVSIDSLHYQSRETTYKKGKPSTSSSFDKAINSLSNSGKVGDKFLYALSPLRKAYHDC